MSTLQTTPLHRNKTGSRQGARVLALSTLAAIGLVLLVLTPTNQHATSPTTASIAHQASLRAQTQARAGCFRDPTTHALTCSHIAPFPHIAPSTDANPAPTGYFRDPATHELLRLPTAQQPAGKHPANHSRGRIIA